MFAHVAYVCILSEMYGASGASGTIRRGGSETGLSGEAACSTWELARWEKHRVSCKEILCVCYLNLINICSCYDMMVMVQPFNSCLKTTISEAFPVSCLFLGCEQMSQQRVVWRLQAVGVTQRGSLSLFRLHFEKLKQIPVLQLDASVEFQSDPDVREQFITKVRFDCCTLI